MSQQDLSTTKPVRLARFLQMSGGEKPLWHPEELGAILRHQLSTAIEYDLSSLAQSAARSIKLAAAAHGLLLRSFGDLFQHPNPPLELLKMTKQFAKANRDQPDSPLPPEVSALVYYASIAAALFRCRQRITTLTDDSLREGLVWGASLEWVDEPTRRLFTETLALLEKGESRD